MPTSPTTPRTSRPPAARRAPSGRKTRRAAHRRAQVDRRGHRLAQGDHAAAATSASVTFRQSYRSDVLKSNSRKTLVMVRADGRWQIRRGERAADAPARPRCCCLAASQRVRRRRRRRTGCRACSRRSRRNRLDDALTRVDALIARAPELPPRPPGARRPAARALAAAADLRQRGEDRAAGEGRRTCATRRCPPARAARSARPRTACRATCCSCTPSRSTCWWSTRAARGSTSSPTPQGRPQLIADYYVTLGKNGIDKAREGDQKTPVGVYHVTANLPRKKLTDFYGAGAFPINYPNEWDNAGRAATATASGCTACPRDVYSRPPRASDGCIVLANPDLESVGQHVQVGLTPVIIADEIEWSDAAAVESRARGARRRARAVARATGRAAIPSATSRTTRRVSPRRRPGPRGLGRAQAQGERRASSGSRSASRAWRCSATRASAISWSSPSTRTTARAACRTSCASASTGSRKARAGKSSTREPDELQAFVFSLRRRGDA